MEKIDLFLEENFFLSNFFMRPFMYKGKEYKSVEHAYQSYKADNEEEHEYIRSLDTAGQAKRKGRQVSMRKDWEDIKYDLMLDLVRTKFLDMYLSKQLLDTNDKILIEGNNWHDNLWGDCNCEYCKSTIGKNWLGDILMKVREELKENQFD